MKAFANETWQYDIDVFQIKKEYKMKKENIIQNFLLNVTCSYMNVIYKKMKKKCL